MARKPNPLLLEFLDQDLPLPEINWETVPFGVNPRDAWEMFDENVEGWVPIWFPTGDLCSGKSFGEFERAYETFTLPAGGYVHHEFEPGFSAHWARVVADTPCKATAWFVYT